MRELSIFIDESGDFGSYAPHSPFYLISMVFHDQSKDISEPIRILEDNLRQLGFSNNYYIHTGPVIRREGEYKNMDLEARRKLISKLAAFYRKTDSTYHVFQIQKKEVKDVVDAVDRLSKQIADFVRENQEFFYSFDKVKIYYDNGQSEVTKIILSVFNSLLQNTELKKLLPSDYKLFQAADLVCTFRLIHLKLSNGKGLSKSELAFFHTEKKLQKNYIKPLLKKEFNRNK